MSLEWLHEIEWQDVLDKDTALIAESCGPEILMRLWEELPNMSLYISEVPLNEARRRYVRHMAAEAARQGKQIDVKRLAVKLAVSERFVFAALATTDKKDERQEKLF